MRTDKSAQKGAYSPQLDILGNACLSFQSLSRRLYSVICFCSCSFHLHNQCCSFYRNHSVHNYYYISVLYSIYVVPPKYYLFIFFHWKILMIHVIK